MGDAAARAEEKQAGSASTSRHETVHAGVPRSIVQRTVVSCK